MRSSVRLALISAALARAAVVPTDPCVAATGSYWVSASAAHACELAVPFDQARSEVVISNTIKALQFYSLETWFLASPNPLIPHNVDIRARLTDIQNNVLANKYATDWDFNIAVSNAFDLEQDGHTVWAALCTEAFTWNHPFSVANWAPNPYVPYSSPYVVTNYDLPLQGRPGLEAYYLGLGLDARAYDGFQMISINGQDANQYLYNLAATSSIYTGLIGAYETVEPRYMRLVSRYSADTISGNYTQEVGRFAMRGFYPGATSIDFVLRGNGSDHHVTVPWAAHFAAAGSTTDTFVAKSCVAPAAPAAAAMGASEGTVKDGPTQKTAVVAPDAGWLNWPVPIEEPEEQSPINPFQHSPPQLAPPRWGPWWGFGGKNGQSNSNGQVTPNLKSFGTKVTTVDIYQLQQHPKVGVVYIEQFEPSDGTTFNEYVTGVSNALYTGLTALKAAGVKHLLIDQSGNRGGYIFAGAVALWSLWPNDLYPGFPAVLRDLDLARRESDREAAAKNYNSEYFYGNYRDLNYQLLTSNSQFMDPPVPQVVNGVADAYSKQFFDDFGDSSANVTKFTSPPFAGSDIVMVANSICASTCSVFSSYLYQKHGVRSAVFGPPSGAIVGQFDGGVKGSEVTSYAEMLYELGQANLTADPAAIQPLPIQLGFTMNFRNAIPYTDKQDGILEYVYEPDTRKYSYTKQTYNRPQAVWEFVAGEFFGYN